MSAERTITVLAVDDDAASRRATLRWLRQAGYRTRQAASGEQALRIVAKERPDLVVLNDDLEGARGPELARRIKDLPEGAAIPILHLASAQAAPGRLPEEVELGRDGYLSLPADPATLVTLTTALLRARRAEAALEEMVRAREEAEPRARRARECKKVLDAIMDYLPVAILVVDAPEASVHMVSKYASQLAGLTPESMIGLSAEELVKAMPLYLTDGVTPVAAEEMHVVRAAKYGEEAAAQQWVVARSDGERMTVLSTAGPICDREERVIGGVVVWQDITPLQRLQEERERLIRDLEEQRRFLEAVLNNAPSGIVVMDEEARMVLSNPAAEAIMVRPAPLGEEYESLAGLHLLRPDGTPFPPRELPPVRAALDGESITGAEATVALPDGTRRDMRGNTSPIRDETGNIVGAILVFQDITEQKQIQRELERLLEVERERGREARLLETILEATPSLTAYLDREFRYRAADSLYAAGLGLSREEIVGKRHAELFSHAPRTTEWLAQVRDTGEPIVVREIPPASPLPGRPPDGIRVDVTMTPVKDEHGEVEGIVLFVIDVTEKVQAREKLLETERARARLAETLNEEINHRVKNNLMMVVGLLQMQIAGETDTRAATALHDAMTRLLTFAEIHAQLRFAETEEVDLLTMTQRIAEVTRRVFAKADVEFQVEGDSVPCSAKEATPLLIVINELITNAVKHGAPAEERKLRVEVAVRREGGNVRVGLWNSGNPVPPDFNPRGHRTMGMLLAWEVVVGRYQGAFTVRPERGGTRVEVVVGYGALRE